MHAKFSVDEVLECVDRIPTQQDFDRVVFLRDNMKMTTKHDLDKKRDEFCESIKFYVVFAQHPLVTI